MIQVGFNQIIPNSIHQKDEYIEFSEYVFSNFPNPSLEEVYQMVGNKPEITQWIKNASIFSMNFNKLDKTYAKRLWRLSKNLNFLYDKKYWSFCYEHRDCL